MKKIISLVAILGISFTLTLNYISYYKLYYFWDVLEKNKVSYIEYQFPKIYYMFNEDKDYKYLIRLEKEKYSRPMNYDFLYVAKYIKYIEETNKGFDNDRLETIEYMLKQDNYKYEILFRTTNKHVFKFFLSQGADINILKDDKNILQLNDDIEFIKYLIKSGIDINHKTRKTRRNSSQNTPLITFIKKYNETRDNKYIEIIELLLKSGADVEGASSLTNNNKIINLIFKYDLSYDLDYKMNRIKKIKKMQKGKTLYMLNTLISGDTNAFKYLILMMNSLNSTEIEDIDILSQRKIYVNKRDEKDRNKLYYVESFDEAKLLIDKGININNVDKNKDTPIMFFIKKYYIQNENSKKEYRKVIELLLKHKVNLIGTLFSAKNIEIIALLEKNGVNIKKNNKSIYLKNIIYFVEDLEVIKYLIKRGINIHHKLTHSHIDTPLMTFTEKYNNTKDDKYIEIIKFLLEEKVNTKGILKVIKDKRISDLMSEYGVYNKNQFSDLIFNKRKYSKLEIETLKLLIKEGLDINKRDKRGKTLLSKFSKKYPNRDMILFLLENGAEIDKSSKKNIFRIKDIELVEYLIDKGLYFKNRNRNRNDVYILNSFLKKYIQNDNIDKDRYLKVIKLLLKNGVSANNSLRYVTNRDRKMINILLKYGGDINDLIYNKKILNYTDDIEFIKYLINNGIRINGTVKLLLGNYPKNIKDREQYNKIIRLLVKNMNKNRHIYNPLELEKLQLIIDEKDWFKLLNSYRNSFYKDIIYAYKSKLITAIKSISYRKRICGTRRNKIFQEIENLLKNGTDTSHVLFVTSDVKIVKLIFKYNVNIEETNNGLTPLLYHIKYVQGDNHKMIELLIKKGVNLYAKDKAGENSLYYLANALKLSIKEVEDIIKNGKLDLSKTKYAKRKVDFVAETMKKSAKNDRFVFGINGGFINKEIELMRFSISHCKADCNCTDLIKVIRSMEKIWNSYSCIMTAQRIKDNIDNYDKIFKKIENLLKNGTDTSHILFVTSNIKIIKLVFKYGVDIEETNNNGLTPLLYHLIYVQDYNYKMIELLIEKGANLYTKNRIERNSLYYLSKALKLSIKDVEDIIKNGKLDLSKTKYAGYQKPRPDMSYVKPKDFVAETMKKVD